MEKNVSKYDKSNFFREENNSLHPSQELMNFYLIQRIKKIYIFKDTSDFSFKR